MAIVVEDGSQVSGANSYVTEAELSAYATARGTSLTVDTEQLLIRAMDYVESLEYQGSIIAETQPLQWPRSPVIVDGYDVSSTTIPTLLKEGLMETAIAIDGGTDPLADLERTTTKETVGPISVEYETGSATVTVQKITNKLKKLLTSSPDSNNITISRG